MANRTNWIDLIPKYTTFVGDQVFRGDPIPVVGYDRIDFVYWRAALIGTSSTFQLKFEGSIDGETWTQLHVGDPGTDTETVFTLSSVDYPWLRAVVTLAGANCGATCWVRGIFIKRRS